MKNGHEFQVYIHKYMLDVNLNVPVLHDRFVRRTILYIYWNMLYQSIVDLNWFKRKQISSSFFALYLHFLLCSLL